MAKARAAVMTARRQRPAPYLDDKVITSWNGLMVTKCLPPPTPPHSPPGVVLESTAKTISWLFFVVPVVGMTKLGNYGDRSVPVDLKIHRTTANINGSWVLLRGSVRGTRRVG